MNILTCQAASALFKEIVIHMYAIFSPLCYYAASLLSIIFIMVINNWLDH